MRFPPQSLYWSARKTPTSVTNLLWRKRKNTEWSQWSERDKLLYLRRSASSCREEPSYPHCGPGYLWSLQYTQVAPILLLTWSSKLGTLPTRKENEQSFKVLGSIAVQRIFKTSECYALLKCYLYWVPFITSLRAWIKMGIVLGFTSSANVVIAGHRLTIRSGILKYRHDLTSFIDAAYQRVASIKPEIDVTVY